MREVKMAARRYWTPKLNYLLSLLLLAVSTAMAAEKGEEPKKILPEDTELDPKKWGIHNNCIHTNRIRSLSFIDEQSAVIKIPGKKAILMTLSRRCPGVKRSGISYKSRNGQLCGKFDRITVIDNGISCQIKSFEPYLLPPEDIDESGDGK